MCIRDSGGSYASNFNRFSKLYRVMVQADPTKRVTQESLNHFYVRVGDGMAPLSQFCLLYTSNSGKKPYLLPKDINFPVERE